MNPTQVQNLRVSRGREGDRCPYCHDVLTAEERQRRCEACEAGHHPECFSAHGGCSACQAGAGAPGDVQVVWEGSLQMLTTPEVSTFLWEPPASGRGLMNLAYAIIVGGAIAIGAAHPLAFPYGVPISPLVFGIVMIAFAPLLMRMRRRGGQRSGHISMDSRGLALGAPWGRGEQVRWSQIKGFSITRGRGGCEVFLEGRGRRRLARLKEEAAAELLYGELRRGLNRFKEP